MMSHLIILDRDGVINQDSDEFIKSCEEFVPLPGSIEAIAQLSRAGYKIYIATNQSGIARGLFNLKTLEQIHNKLLDLLQPLGGKIEQIYFCPHGPDDHCKCRKPKPELICQIARDYYRDSHFSLANDYVLGDSIRDLQAGIAAGAKVALVKTGKGLASLKKITDENLEEFKQIPVYEDLADFTRQLLTQHNTRKTGN